MAANVAAAVGVSVLSSIIGGKSSEKAAKTAAGAQIEANQASIDFMDKWLEINRGDLKQAVDQGMVDINEAFGDAISTTETGTNAALNAINQAAYGTPYSEPGAIPVEEIIRSIPEMPPRQKITADMQKPVQPTTQTQPQTSGMNQSQLQQWAQGVLTRAHNSGGPIRGMDDYGPTASSGMSPDAWKELLLANPNLANEYASSFPSGPPAAYNAARGPLEATNQIPPSVQDPPMQTVAQPQPQPQPAITGGDFQPGVTRTLLPPPEGSAMGDLNTGEADAIKTIMEGYKAGHINIDDAVGKSMTALAGAETTAEGRITTGYDRSRGELQAGTQQASDYLSPLLDMGPLNRAKQLAMDPSTLSDGKYYQWLKGQGEEALKGRMSTLSGGGPSGPGVKAGVEYGQNFANTFLNDRMNQLMTMANVDIAAREKLSQLAERLGINMATMSTQEAQLLSGIAERFGISRAEVQMQAGRSRAALSTGEAERIGSIQEAMAINRANLRTGTASNLANILTGGATNVANLQTGLGTNLANIGIGGATTGAQNVANFAGPIAGLTSERGTILGNQAINQSNAFNNMLSGVTGSVTDAILMNKLLGNKPGQSQFGAGDNAANLYALSDLYGSPY